MNKMFKFAAPLAAAMGSAGAFAQEAGGGAPATAVAALTELSGATTGFGPVLFGIAVASSVIVIGIAWIKKGRGAAK